MPDVMLVKTTKSSI